MERFRGIEASFEWLNNTYLQYLDCQMKLVIQATGLQKLFRIIANKHKLHVSDSNLKLRHDEQKGNYWKDYLLHTYNVTVIYKFAQHPI